MRKVRHFATSGIMAVAIGAAAALCGEPAFAQSPPLEFAPGQLIVGYATEADQKAAQAELKAAASSFNIGPNDKARSLVVEPLAGAALRLRIQLPVTMQAQAAADPNAERRILESLAAQMKQSDKRIKYAHPNWIIRLEPPVNPTVLPKKSALPNARGLAQAGGPNDPAYTANLHWDYGPLPAGMNAAGAWRMTKGDATVVVAVVDSGIIFNHPDIKATAHVLAGYNFVSAGSGRNADATDRGNPQFPEKSHWHGTHVAGTIGAVGTNNGVGTSGINWAVKILPVRVLDGAGAGTFEDIADGVRWAAGLPVPGAPLNKNKAHVINMSLGGPIPCTEDAAGALLDAIKAARAAGSVIVVAAGNDSIDQAGVTPSSCTGVISVAASDIKGHLTGYSNFGDVTIMAPGGDSRQAVTGNLAAGIWSSVAVTKANPYGYAAMDGTSMAAPHVAGAIALALAAHPDWRFKPDLITERLVASAVPASAEACAKPCGAGQLDAYRLLTVDPAVAAAKSPRRTEVAVVAPPRTTPTPAMAATAAPTAAAATVPTAGRVAGLDGTWRSVNSGATIDINGSEWRHDEKGLATIQPGTGATQYEVIYLYAAGTRCTYRITAMNGRDTLLLEPTNPGQSPDYCPSGQLQRVPR